MEKISVLLVDDDSDYLDSCKMLLESEFRVTVAEDNKQAFSLLLEAEGAIQVVVIDMGMGSDNEAGLKLIQEIEKIAFFRKPISIVLTGIGDLKNAAKCMEIGARGYVEKGNKETPNILKQCIYRAAEYREALYMPNIIHLFIDLIENYNPFTVAMKQLKAGEFEVAKKNFDTEINAIGKDHPYYKAAFCVAAGNLYLASKDPTKYQRAIEYYTQAINLYPSFAEIYYKRGLAFQMQDMWEKAILDYKEASTIIPTYLEAHFALGEAHFLNNSYLEAAASFDHALDICNQVLSLNLNEMDLVRFKKLKTKIELQKQNITENKK